MSEKDKNAEQDAKFSVRKLEPFFIDEVANISISPNGACRLQFITWQTGKDNKPLRMDSEIILTIQSLKTLASSLPQAIEQAEKAMTERQNKPAINKTSH